MPSTSKLRGMPYSRKEYIPGAPSPKITRFTLGKVSAHYRGVYRLVAAEAGLLSHGALEAARVSANKAFEVRFGEGNYFLRVIPYPHIVVRERKVLTMAGADRLSQGMQKAFGRPTALAAKVSPGLPIIEVSIPEPDLALAKKAFETASSKLPLKCVVKVVREQSAGEPG